MATGAHEALLPKKGGWRGALARRDGTSHQLASSVTLSRHSAHGQEKFHLRMLLKSWSQGTVDRFEEIGGPLYRFNQDENPLPFDLWIEGQNCSSGSFDYLSELWEFLVYIGKWH